MGPRGGTQGATRACRHGFPPPWLPPARALVGEGPTAYAWRVGAYARALEEAAGARGCGCRYSREEVWGAARAGVVEGFAVRGHVHVHAMVFELVHT